MKKLKKTDLKIEFVPEQHVVRKQLIKQYADAPKQAFGFGRRAATGTDYRGKDEQKREGPKMFRFHLVSLLPLCEVIWYGSLYRTSTIAHKVQEITKNRLRLVDSSIKGI